MKKQDKIVAVIVTGILFLAFSAIWMWLELAFYGEVQTRIVDDIISIIIMISFYNNVRISLMGK